MLRLALALLATALLAVFALPPALELAGLAPDRALVPPPGRAVEIGDGLRLNVVETGSGPPVVLVHGLPSNVGDWADLPERLAALGHRVVAYDRIGYGWSGRRAFEDPGAYTYASSARDLEALLDALDLRRAVLVGWSYGGGVVQIVAAEHPERAARVVLLGSVGPALAGEDEDALDRLVRTPLGRPLFEWVGRVPPLARALTAEPLAAAFSGAEHVPPGWHARTLAQLALPGTITAWIAEEQRHDPSVFRPEQIAAPALVLHGADDRSVPLAIGEDLARRLPDARLVAVEAGSHMLPVTHGELVAQQIHAFATGRR